MRKILLSLAAFAVFFMTSLGPFIHTAEAWNPRPWNPKPWNPEQWKPEHTELEKWELKHNDMQSWELKEWVLVHQEMVSWELESNPDLSYWEMKHLEMIAWELKEWELALQGPTANQPGGLEGNTSANSPPDSNEGSVIGPEQYPADELNYTPVTGTTAPEGNGDEQGQGSTGTPTSATEEMVLADDAEVQKKGPSDWDAIKFISKDVIGATVNYVDKLARSEEDATLKDFSAFQRGLFMSGVKTLTKGNDVSDIFFQGKGVFDGTKKAYEAISDYKTVRQAKALTEAGRIDEALRLASNVKTYTPTNAVVSGLLLPISAIDTVQSFNKISGTSGWDRADAIVDTLGNAGGFIAGLSAPVAMIPGGQVVAAGLLAVGSILSAGSLIYKAARNWRKIGSTIGDVGRKIGNAGSKALDGVKNFGSKIGSWFKG